MKLAPALHGYLLLLDTVALAFPCVDVLLVLVMMIDSSGGGTGVVGSDDSSS